MTDKPKYKQRSGAQNKKRLINTVKKQVLEELKLPNVEKLDSVNSWQSALDQKMYSNAFDSLGKPALKPGDVQPVIEIPIYGSPPPVVINQINQILQQQRQAFFLSSADFCDSMLTNDRIQALLQVRINSLLGSTINLIPGDESDMAKTIQEDCDHNFAKMMPVSELSELLRWGLLIGNAITRIDWETDVNKWMPKLHIFHPRYMYYNWAIRKFMLSTQSNGQVVIDNDDISWGLFTPYTEHLPWLRGLIYGLAMKSLTRGWLEQWWARLQERNGMPIFGAVTSAEATPEEEALFIRQLANLGSNATVRLPQGIEGNKFDLKMIQPQSDLFEGFKQYLEYIDESLAILILGQGKTTKTGTGLSATKDAGEKVRIDLMRFDANALGHFLREKVLKPYVRFNYGEQYENLTPEISFDIEDPEDLQESATTIKDLFTGLKIAADLNIGEMMDVRAILSKFELPLNEISKTNEDIPGVMNTNLEPDDAKNYEKLDMINSYAELRKMLRNG